MVFVPHARAPGPSPVSITDAKCLFNAPQEKENCFLSASTAGDFLTLADQSQAPVVAQSQGAERKIEGGIGVVRCVRLIASTF